ncbi:uncharacterized protein LOC126162621 [Schistocerca cancellata]|uniref:uncharacterized protein LOC126162621 n=1 Tax=Schistocerca cancellata TaxID=274614 RepID=UPI0021179720|nr:uncharacterized protein LOC126162621 [Schistocerca cancellata]
MRTRAAAAWLAAAAALALQQVAWGHVLSRQDTSLSSQSRETRAARGDHMEEDHMDEHPGHAKSDSALSYYEFLINEGSYKFWAWFQLATAALLIYSVFAAIYYSKYTYYTIASDYDYDYFFKRSGEPASAARSAPTTQSSTFLGLSAQTYQRILDAITSKNYS